MERSHLAACNVSTGLADRTAKRRNMFSGKTIANGNCVAKMHKGGTFD